MLGQTNQSTTVVLFTEYAILKLAPIRRVVLSYCKYYLFGFLYIHCLRLYFNRLDATAVAAATLGLSAGVSVCLRKNSPITGKLFLRRANI